MLAVGGVLSAVDRAAAADNYASQVITYDNSGSNVWSDPNAVLGPPTVDTAGDFSMFEPIVAVVPAFPAWQPAEIYRVGRGTSLVVRFAEPVSDDPLNPCGVDFIVYGNAFYLPAVNSSSWTNGDPNLFTLGPAISEEPGMVSVSRDGQTWYGFGPRPCADCFAATLGRMYDPQHPDPALENNAWWGRPTLPAYPLNPAWTTADFTGRTLAEVARGYGYSAGGTGFDLSTLQAQPTWILYVRIDNPAGSPITPEIDALAAVHGLAFPDLDCDSDVDADDLGVFEGCFTGPARGPIQPPACLRADFDGDGDIDLSDFGLLQRCYAGPDVLMDWNCMETPGVGK